MADKTPELIWERLGGPNYMQRARIPGGWLVISGIRDGGGLTFIPDAHHKWTAAEQKKTNEKAISDN